MLLIDLNGTPTRVSVDRCRPCYRIQEYQVTPDVPTPQFLVYENNQPNYFREGEREQHERIVQDEYAHDVEREVNDQIEDLEPLMVIPEEEEYREDGGGLVPRRRIAPRLAILDRRYCGPERTSSGRLRRVPDRFGHEKTD